jgi:hypothetical protein
MYASTLGMVALPFATRQPDGIVSSVGNVLQSA